MSNTKGPNTRNPSDDSAFSFITNGGKSSSDSSSPITTPAKSTITAQDKGKQPAGQASCAEGKLEIIDVLGLGLYEEVSATGSGARGSGSSVNERLSTTSLTPPGTGTAKGQGMQSRTSLFYEHLNESMHDWTSVQAGMETPKGAFAEREVVEDK